MHGEKEKVFHPHFLLLVWTNIVLGVEFWVELINQFVGK